jgi:hypothetical protein
MGKSLLIGGALVSVGLIGFGLMINGSGNGGSAAPPPGSDPYSQPQAQEPEPGPAPQPVATPAPTPVPVPALQRPQPAALSGIWRSRDGEVYSFEQQGNEIALTLQMAGGIVGVGQGVLTGSILQLVIAVPSGATQVQASCALQAAPDWRSFDGLCARPTGQYAVSIFR